MDLREPIDGQHAIIVEDIADSGKTLKYLYQVLQWHNPASLKTCVLLRKNKDILDAPIDYVGFDIPNAEEIRRYQYERRDKSRVAEVMERRFSEKEHQKEGEDPKQKGQ